MSSIYFFVLPNWLLIDLASVAIGVSLACTVAILLSILARRIGNPVRHAFLVSALLLSMLCPVFVGLAQRFEWSLIQLAALNTAAQEVGTINGSSHTVDATPPSATPHQRTERLVAAVPPSAEQTQKLAVSEQPNGNRAPAPPMVGGETASPSHTRSWRGIASLVAWVWFIGTSVTLVSVLRGALFVRRFGRTCVAVTDERLLNAMRCAEQRVPLPWQVPLQVSAFTLTPLVIGLWRPRVVVPNRMDCELDDEQLVDVFTHELAHLQRRDHWIGVLQRAAMTCYWWHPLIGWASGLIGDVRERICDDVASAASSEHRYARALVKLAELVVDQPRIPAAIGILSFKGNHLSLRISRLLEMDRPRETALGIRGWIAFVLVTGVVGCSMVFSTLATPTTATAADEPQAPKQKAPDQTPTKEPTKETTGQTTAVKPPFRFPDQVSGTIVTEDGKPIPRAAVTFEFGNAVERRPLKVLRRLQLTTDERGVYVANTRDFPAVEEAGFDIILYASADGFAEGTSAMWYSGSEAPVMKLAEVKLPAGRTVRGRIQGTGGQVPEQVILHAMAAIDRGNIWRQRPVAIGADGAFVISVPKAIDAELMVVSSNFAPVSVTVPVATAHLDTVTLPVGTSVTGRVLDRDGKPVAGCVILAEERMERRFPAYRATKTNARGEYRLAPLRGEFKIHLAESASTSDRIDGSDFESDNKPPPFVPLHVTLNGEANEQQVDLKAGPVLTVRGTVRWADGRPAPKCEIMAWSESVLLDRMSTGPDGSYSMQLPKPITDIAISAIGLRDQQRVFHIAHPVCKAPARQKTDQFLVFDKLEQDLNDADWELRRFEPALPQKTEAGSDELSRLRQKYEEQQVKYDAADKAAKTPDEQMQLYRTQDPRNVVGPELLTLEAKYRGQPTGIEAFAWLFQMACSVGMPDIPISKAREQAVDVLFEHYLNHPELDLFLAQFESGPRCKRGEELLRAALKSSHRKVRAAASYRLASYRWYQAGSRDQYQPVLDLLADDPKNAPRLDYLKAALREFEVPNPGQARAEAEQLAEQVRKDYAELTPPHQNYWTYGELAEALLFEMRYLGSGKIAPEIQGTDAQGNPVHLTKLRGKLVVVSFTYGDPHDIKHLQELSQRYSRDKVAIINIMSMGKLEEITQRTQAGDITWPVIVDPQYGPITRRWNIDSWPSNFVIDPSGVICGIQIPTDRLNSFVERILAKQK